MAIIPMKKRRRLVWKNNRWYEDGKPLRKHDYIFHADAHEGECIISCLTGQKYRIREAIFM